MGKTIVFFIIFLFLAVTNGQVFETEHGKIELLGLEKWDGQTLLDSMASLNPRKSLHACAAQMKSDFGFAEVSVMSYLNADYSSIYTVVTIVEDNETKNIE